MDATKLSATTRANINHRCEVSIWFIAKFAKSRRRRIFISSIEYVIDTLKWYWHFDLSTQNKNNNSHQYDSPDSSFSTASTWSEFSFGGGGGDVTRDGSYIGGPLRVISSHVNFPLKRSCSLNDPKSPQPRKASSYLQQIQSHLFILKIQRPPKPPGMKGAQKIRKL